MRKRRKYTRGKSKADKALRLAKKLKREVDGEKKIKDIEVSAQNLSTTPFLVLLSDINQGDTHATRCADRIKAWTNHCKAAIEYVSNGQWYITLGILVKKNNTVTAPTFVGTAATDLVETAATAIGQTMASNHWHNRGAYKVLWRMTIPPNTDDIDNLFIEKFTRLGHRVFYNAATASGNDMKGNLWLFAYSNATSNYPKLTVYNRFKYVDN